MRIIRLAFAAAALPVAAANKPTTGHGGRAQERSALAFRLFRNDPLLDGEAVHVLFTLDRCEHEADVMAGDYR
jgi:hypothetical protein